MPSIDTASLIATSRPFCAVERGVDVFDRMATLNFTVVANVHGHLDAHAIMQGVRALEKRHPLLRAGVVRTAGPRRFVAEAAAPIPITEIHAPYADTLRHIEPLLAHQIWLDDGPRAVLHVVRHGPLDTTLLLTPHHLVSDGSSGIMAMRDLLQFIAGERSPQDPPVPSPGQQCFLPAAYQGLKPWLAVARYALSAGLMRSPLRLQPANWREDNNRHVQLGVIRLSEAQTEQLRQRARASGSTVHGVLGAIFARAVASTCDHQHPRINITHAVDMRKYLRDKNSVSSGPGQASGYYVSGINTHHRLDGKQPLAMLAKEITRCVHASMDKGEPMLTIPHLLPWLAASARRSGNLSSLGARFEQWFFQTTFGLTNLGPLESLGVTEKIGALQLNELYFCAAGSVFYSLGAAITTFAGRLTLTMNWLPTRVPSEQAHKILHAIEQELIGC